MRSGTLHDSVKGRRRFDTVAVLMGGPSAERDVSLRSGAAVADGLRQAGYTVVEIDVTGRALDIPEPVQAVFVALHGEFGEDGRVQALLEQRKLPYTGSGPEASQTAFDKVASKRIFDRCGIPHPTYEVLQRGASRRLPLPVVVKPARQGSSIGVHRVREETDWPAAFEDALRHGPDVIVEAYIAGRELTVGIVEDEALPVVEIAAPDAWYDYRAKYTPGATSYLVPAPVDDTVARACSQAALQAFHVLGCRGFARVDFRYAEDGGVFVLEVNSIPGFTETSLLPKAAAGVGMAFSELCDRILRCAKNGEA